MPPARRVVEVFADVSCPFAHFSLRRFVARRQADGIDDVRLRVRAWPLELVNETPLGAAAVQAEIDDARAQVAGDLFRGFDPTSFPTSTVGVLGTATLAYEHGLVVGEAFNLAVRDALFEHGRPVGQPDVLADIARRHGVDVPDLTTARAAVDADLADGRRRGVVGSPHFFIDEQPFFCPALDIERQGDHLRIGVDHDAVEAFLARALG